MTDRERDELILRLYADQAGPNRTPPAFDLTLQSAVNVQGRWAHCPERAGEPLDDGRS